MFYNSFIVKRHLVEGRIKKYVNFLRSSLCEIIRYSRNNFCLILIHLTIILSNFYFLKYFFQILVQVNF